MLQALMLPRLNLRNDWEGNVVSSEYTKLQQAVPLFGGLRHITKSMVSVAFQNHICVQALIHD